MFDQDAINARRNPLTADQERIKKLTVKKYHSEDRKPDQVYALAYLDGETEKYFYVGVTINPTTRWRDHKKAIELGVDPKPAYDEARFIGVERVYMKVLDAEGEFTEADWMAILQEQGHHLTNATGGNDVKRKHHKPDPLNALLKGSAMLEHGKLFDAIMKNPLNVRAILNEHS